jgi:catechol 2,3-dioxygenase-like lactoylglutathione lyase family enzyme
VSEFTFERLHHSAFTIPEGEEQRARDFYSGVLGLTEVQKPDTMNRARGGWFRSVPEVADGTSGIEIHIIPDAQFTPNRLGHPAIIVDDLDALAASLTEHGAVVEPDGRFPGHRRFHTYDFFGNQIEFLQAD